MERVSDYYGLCPMLSYSVISPYHIISACVLVLEGRESQIRNILCEKIK